MSGILIIAHAPLASALKACARHTFPDCAATLEALDVPPDLPVEDVEAQARALLDKVRNPDALILTDVFGATPSNACGPFLERGVVEMVTGVNLPMVMRLGMQGQPKDVTALADWVQGKGVKSIVHVGDPPAGCRPANPPPLDSGVDSGETRS